jgi:hypothetical protein
MSKPPKKEPVTDTFEAARFARGSLPKGISHAF